MECSPRYWNWLRLPLSRREDRAIVGKRPCLHKNFSIGTANSGCDIYVKVISIDGKIFACVFALSPLCLAKTKEIIRKCLNSAQRLWIKQCYRNVVCLLDLPIVAHLIFNIIHSFNFTIVFKADFVVRSIRNFCFRIKPINNFQTINYFGSFEAIHFQDILSFTSSIFNIYECGPRGRS